jgi:hypothetical protein
VPILLASRGDHLRIIGIQDQIELRSVQVLLVWCGCSRGHPVGVIKEEAQITSRPTQVSEHTVGSPTSIRG